MKSRRKEEKINHRHYQATKKGEFQILSQDPKATKNRVVAYMANTIGRGGKDHAKAIKHWGKPALKHDSRDESRSFRKFAIRRLKQRFRAAHSKFKMS